MQQKLQSKKHEDYVTHIKNEEDKVYLRTKHFPVNMRLFNTSPEYKAIILQQCEYIRTSCLETKEGYKKPHGMSSANLGLSFNIIGFIKHRNTPEEECMIMINPIITKYYNNKIITISNCGSITLEEPIKIQRSSSIDVKWFDENGKEYEKHFLRETGSLTIQHEVDHNNGILITDLKIK